MRPDSVSSGGRHDGSRVTDPARRLVEVALPVPLFQTFVYSLDGEYEHEARIGSRVLVPFRKRQEIGIVVALDAAPPGRGVIKAVAAVPDAEPALDEGLLALSPLDLGVLRRPARRRDAHRSAGVADRALRNRIRTSRRAASCAYGTTFQPCFNARRRSCEHRSSARCSSSSSRLGGATSVEHLLEQLKFSPSVLKALEKRALISIDRERVERDPFATRVGRSEPRHVPTAEQLAAIDRMGTAASGRGVPAARRDRQWQDAGVHRVVARDSRAPRQDRDRTRPRDRAHAADGRPVPRGVRRRCRSAAQRAE